MDKGTLNQRRNPAVRALGSFAMRDGDWEEAKIFATIGKGLCIWMIWKHAPALIDHENVLFILLLFLITPDLIKKFLVMRTGGNVRSTERSESRTRSTIDHPPPKEEQ